MSELFWGKEEPKDTDRIYQDLAEFYDDKAEIETLFKDLVHPYVVYSFGQAMNELPLPLRRNKVRRLVLHCISEVCIELLEESLEASVD